jgi:hypothetical protein
LGNIEGGGRTGVQRGSSRYLILYSQTQNTSSYMGKLRNYLGKLHFGMQNNVWFENVIGRKHLEDLAADERI